MLEPYHPDCRYLQEAELDYPRIRGLFKLPFTFYLRHPSVSTGHFNAAEFIVCYNQLAYVLFAEAGQQGLIGKLRAFTLEEFKKYQLESCYIVKIDKLKFRKPIDSKQFTGIIEVTKEKQTSNNTFWFQTNTKFTDSREGNLTGEVLLAAKLDSIY